MNYRRQVWTVEKEGILQCHEYYKIELKKFDQIWILDKTQTGDYEYEYQIQILIYDTLNPEIEHEQYTVQYLNIKKTVLDQFLYGYCTLEI